MGILKDIADFIDDASTLVHSANSTFGKADTRSITKKAKEGILNFPVIASNSIEMEKLTTVNRALEKNYASFVQIIYGLDAVGGSNVVAAHHQNMEKGTMFDVLDVMSTTAHGFADTFESYNSAEFDDYVIEAVVLDGTSDHVIAENHRNLREVLEGINEGSLNDLFKPIIEASTPKPGSNRPEVAEGIPTPKFNNQDLKKANDLVPTSITVRINVKDANGNFITAQDFVLGIKCTLHAVSSTEVINNLSNISKGKLFDFVRCTTGEMSFLKDFVLRINEIKTDVANKAAGSSGWWTALKRRAAISKIQGRFKGKGLIPNATIVVNIEEVDYIKEHTGIDILDPRIVGNVMNTYMLLGFVVVDASTDTVSLLFDGNTQFETMSLTGLQREANSNNGTNFKDIMKLMNKF